MEKVEQVRRMAGVDEDLPLLKGSRKPREYNPRRGCRFARSAKTLEDQRCSNVEGEQRPRLTLLDLLANVGAVHDFDLSHRAQRYERHTHLARE